MKALSLVVSDKKIFENCILKTYLLTSWPTYATNWNGLNNFDRGPPRDHSCEVWSKVVSEEMLFKEIVDARTHARTMDDGQWAITKAHLEHFVLRWAKNGQDSVCPVFYFAMDGCRSMLNDLAQMSIVKSRRVRQKNHIHTLNGLVRLKGRSSKLVKMFVQALISPLIHECLKLINWHHMNTLEVVTRHTFSTSYILA